MAIAAKAPEYGEHFTVTDIKERLIQNAHPTTLLLWPPNLFAFTSYILHLSGAYQLVVSPPPGKHWPPSVELLDAVFDHLDQSEALADECRKQLKFVDRRLDLLNKCTKDKYVPWTFLVRLAALQWRDMFDRQDEAQYEEYRKLFPVKAGRVPKAVDGALAQFPPLLQACWNVFAKLYKLGRKHKNVRTIRSLLCNGTNDAGPRDEAWLGAVCLLTMHAIADDASVGWGILENRSMKIDFLPVSDLEDLLRAHCAGGDAWVKARKKIPRYGKRKAELQISEAQKAAARELTDPKLGSMSSIDVARARILPKRHNPDVGITLRSLSSNLAFHHSPIDVRWERDGSSPLAARIGGDPGDQPKESTFSILLLPFPMQVHTRDFHVIDGDAATEALDNREGYGFFRYAPDDRARDVIRDIKVVIDQAREEETTVDMIVLPECALVTDRGGKDESAQLQTYLGGDCVRLPPGGEPVSVFIAGVSERVPKDLSRFDSNNSVNYGFRNDGGFRTGKQHKHHRWQLNKSQIEQYGLSQKLHVGTRWWEAINVERRSVSFINVGDGITICPLICEDLARQDPIADLIRQVGPSLVVTILMDGPQHKDRWSSRYAAILSEDPGSAVLALTSFGMVRRWTTKFGRLSRVVALWNDKEGSREIELEPGASGILLSLKVKSECEVIADGRLEMCPTAKITLTDVIQVDASAGLAPSAAVNLEQPLESLGGV